MYGQHDILDAYNMHQEYHVAHALLKYIILNEIINNYADNQGYLSFSLL
jgi:hypothetical protein